MKGKSLLEVFAVFVLLSVFARWRYALTESLLSPLAQSYLAGALLFLLPLGVMLLTRRDLADYGLTLKRWRYNLDVGLTAYLVRFISWGAGLGLIFWLHSGYQQMAGALILSLTALIEIVVLFSILRRRGENEPRAMPNLLVLGVLLVLPIVVGALMQRLTVDVVSTVF